MKNPTTGRTFRIPVRALALGTVLAGAGLVTFAVNDAVEPVARAALATPTTREFTGVPHQVAPTTDRGAPTTRQTAPPTASGFTVPHQVPSLDDEAFPLQTTLPPGDGSVPHQVEPAGGPTG